MGIKDSKTGKLARQKSRINYLYRIGVIPRPAPLSKAQQKSLDIQIAKNEAEILRRKNEESESSINF